MPAVRAAEQPKIIVVGKGVEGRNRTVSYKLAAKELPSGPVMAAGFAAFLEANASSLTSLTIEWFDDNDDVAIAMSKATDWANDPAVLAVVGFTSSSTAAAAMPILERAGIPVLLPVATSPLLAHSKCAHTASLSSDPDAEAVEEAANGWVTRTIPDDAFQALAIGEALTTLEKQRCLVIKEVDTASREYVNTLSYLVDKTIGSKIVGKLDIERGHWDPELVTTEVIAQEADCVCFLGYSEVGRRVRYCLMPHRMAAAEGKPAGAQPDTSVLLLLPDACISLLPTGRAAPGGAGAAPQIRVMSPAAATGADERVLSRVRGMLLAANEAAAVANPQLGYAITGFRAAELLSEAISRSSRVRSRVVLRQKLASNAYTRDADYWLLGGPKPQELKLNNATARQLRNDLSKLQGVLSSSESRGH